jgi:formamidopyrimidine-DNA glycosylase
MPELPEVEVLVRHLAPALRNRRIRGVRVRRAKVLAPTSPARFQRTLRGATFEEVTRRGKYLGVDAIPLQGDVTLGDGNVGLIYAVKAENITVEGPGTRKTPPSRIA